MFLSRVTDIIDDAVISVPGELTFGELQTMLASYEDKAPPVAIIQPDGSLGGILDGVEFTPELELSPISYMTMEPPLKVAADANAFEVVAQMLARGLDVAAVVSGGLFRGLVTRRSVTRAFGEVTAA